MCGAIVERRPFKYLEVFRGGGTTLAGPDRVEWLIPHRCNTFQKSPPFQNGGYQLATTVDFPAKMSFQPITDFSTV